MADEYRCNQCNQQFPDQDQYNRHMQQQHQGQTPQGGQQQQDNEGGSQEAQRL